MYIYTGLYFLHSKNKSSEMWSIRTRSASGITVMIVCYTCYRIKKVCARSSDNTEYPYGACNTGAFSWRCSGKPGDDYQLGYVTFVTYCAFLNAQCHAKFYDKSRKINLHTFIIIVWFSARKWLNYSSTGRSFRLSRAWRGCFVVGRSIIANSLW